MEIIDLSKQDANENLRWAIIELMVAKTKSSDISLWKKTEPEHPEYLKFNVEVKIDGEEVLFSSLIKTLIERWELAVKKEALEILQNKNDEFYHKMNNLIEEFKYNLLGDND